MGFFDRFTSKKPTPAPAPAPSTPAASSAAPAPTHPPVAAPAPASAPSVSSPPVPSSAAAAPTTVQSRIAAARERLEAKDLPAALALYEELLAASGDRADVLVTVSGDLGTHGHIAPIIELIAPRYDAQRHGPATGLNLLQAYLAARQPEAAQHVLDLLFALDRPELEERLHGFSNAIAELMQSNLPPIEPARPGGPSADAAAEPKMNMVLLSKPVWFYGLEPLAAQILPPKDGRLRRIAFAQLALPGAYKNPAATAQQPEDELARLSRAIPLWLADPFHFSPHYSALGAVAVLTHSDGTPNAPMLISAEWSAENLRQLVEVAGEDLDYIFTGALRHTAGDYELLLRLWEVKKFRERKTFTIRWNPATADTELAKLHETLRAFMEWTPEKRGLPYTPPAHPRAWIDTLGASLRLFLVEKTLCPRELLPSTADALAQAAQHTADGPAESLAFLTLRNRAAQLGLVETIPDATLASSPVVETAEQL